MGVLQQCPIPTFRGRNWLWFGYRQGRRWGMSGGMFLFFAPDPKLLHGIALVEIQDHGFQMASASRRPRSGNHALCLYASDDSRLAEIEQRHAEEYENSGVSLYGWKVSAPPKRARTRAYAVGGSGWGFPRGEHAIDAAEREISALRDPDPWAYADDDPWMDAGDGQW